MVRKMNCIRDCQKEVEIMQVRSVGKEERLYDGVL